MAVKKRPLYGIRIDVDGEMRRVQIPMEDKWPTITRVIGARTTEQRPAGGFNGVNRIAVCDRYATTARGVNVIASRLCGETVYGPVVLLRENALGFPTLMTDGAAYRMQQEVERGW